MIPIDSSAPAAESRRSYWDNLQNHISNACRRNYSRLWDFALKTESSEFRVLSARRAYGLLREKLFDRVHALRLRGFNQLFRGAEINMHLSLSAEMIGFGQFVEMLGDRGSLQIAVRLDRGEI